MLLRNHIGVNGLKSGGFQKIMFGFHPEVQAVICLDDSTTYEVAR